MKPLNLPTKPKIINFPFKNGLFEMFKLVEPKAENCFFFESLSPNKDHLSRYSMLGFNPYIIIKGANDRLFVGGKTYKTKNPYELLREIMPKTALSDEFCGGLVGYLSYESANFFEPSLKLKANPNFDYFRFGLYTDGILHDHLTGETKYFYYQKNRLPFIKRALKNEKVRALMPKLQPLGQFPSRTLYQKQLKSVLDEIKRGNVFQCELGIKRLYKISGSLLPVYEHLREINPSPYLYYVKFGKQKLLGSSPELLLSLNRGQLETFPLAGTTRRGKTKAEDQRLAKKLLADPKEQAEHKMLVDLHRNDLGRVAKFGTVVIKKLMDIKKFSHVQHISSQIYGLLRADEDMFSALAASFPAGTLTGAPKVESMKIISRNERGGRGPYGGAVGFFGFNGNCEFAIPIRSLFASGNKAFVQACGGIVYDSKAQKEYQEIENKLKAMDVVLSKFMRK